MRVRETGLRDSSDHALPTETAFDQARAALDGARTDLLLPFIAPQFGHELPAMVQRTFDRAKDAVIIGCSAGGVIGARAEVEDAPAIAQG